tara:strand:+ start:49 stop:600 length:552 start_codon:yes stop_codon:yes gene_type:complete
MPDYQKGKIYKITSEQLPGKCYIGSTTQTLNRRVNGHKEDYKRYLKGTRRSMTSSIIICYADAKITLIEDFPCESKKELHMREGLFIRRCMEDNKLDDVVNKFIPGRSQKEYNIDIREEINRKERERYHKNKQVNRVEKNRKDRERYHKNKEVNRDEVNRQARERYHAKNPQSKKNQSKISPV